MASSLEPFDPLGRQSARPSQRTSHTASAGKRPAVRRTVTQKVVEQQQQYYEGEEDAGAEEAGSGYYDGSRALDMRAVAAALPSTRSRGPRQAATVYDEESVDDRDEVQYGGSSRVSAGSSSRQRAQPVSAVRSGRAVQAVGGRTMSDRRNEGVSDELDSGEEHIVSRSGQPTAAARRVQTQPPASTSSVSARGRGAALRSQQQQQQQEDEVEYDEQPYRGQPATAAVRGSLKQPSPSSSVTSSAGRSIAAARSPRQETSIASYGEYDGYMEEQPQQRSTARSKQTAAPVSRQQQAGSGTVSVGRRVVRREVVEEEEEELEEEEQLEAEGDEEEGADYRSRDSNHRQPGRKVAVSAQQVKRSSSAVAATGRGQVGRAAKQQYEQEEEEEDEDEQQRPTQRGAARTSAAATTQVDRRGAARQANRGSATAARGQPRAAGSSARRGGRSQVDEDDEEDEDGVDGDMEDEYVGEDEEYDAAAEMDADRGRNPDGSLKDPRLWRIRLQHTKSGMGLNKNIVTWTFVHRGERHIVELAHSTFGGKRTIRVDGIVKISEKKVLDNGSKYHLEATSSKHSSRSVMIAVELRPVGVSGVTYELYVDARDYDAAKRYWLYHND